MTSRPRVLLLSAILILVCAGNLRAQEEIFSRGNQLYQEGDFTGAIEAYVAVRSAGFDGAALHYNLGNAYFKTGELGRAILEWERALELSPRDTDAAANLELARSLTADAVEPLPRFWLFSVLSWWLTLIPRGALIVLVAVAWVLTGVGMAVRVWSRSPEVGAAAGWLAVTAAAVVVVFGANLFARELRIGQPVRAIVMADVVPVRSAPAEQDDLTLFEIHEGTRVRIDRRTGSWAEVVLDDGKVGWVPEGAIEAI